MKMITLHIKKNKLAGNFAGLLFAVAAILTTTLCFSGPAADIAGFVSAVNGTATLSRGGGKAVTLDGMNSLRIGDSVQVQPKSSIIVNLCAAGSKLDVKGEAVFTVTKTGLTFTKGKSAPKGKIAAKSCETLSASAAKFDTATTMKDEVAEAVGAMSVMGILSKASGGGSGAGLQDVLNSEMEKQTEAYEMMERSSKSSQGSFDGDSYGLGGYDSGSGSGSGSSYESKSFDGENDSGTAYDVAPGGYGGGYDTYEELDEEPIYEDKIYKPEVIYSESPEIIETNVMSRAFISWYPAYDAVKYSVKIFNSVDAEIFSAIVDKAHLIYPDDAATPLTPGGWFLCEVQGLDETGVPVSFDLLGLDVMDADTQKIFLAEEKALLDTAATGEPSAYQMLGKIYDSNGLLPDALDAYEKALVAQPENEAIRLRLAELNENLM